MERHGTIETETDAQLRSLLYQLETRRQCEELTEETVQRTLSDVLEIGIHQAMKLVKKSPAQ